MLFVINLFAHTKLNICTFGWLVGTAQIKGCGTRASREGETERENAVWKNYLRGADEAKYCVYVEAYKIT